MPWLINAAQLDKFRKSQKALIILDASWHMPDKARDARVEFIEKHIAGAQFFDISDFTQRDNDAQLPHLLLREEAIISAKLGALGLRNDYKIILYDNSPLHTACRALWMLKIFGHSPQQLYILDGGLAAWEQYGGKLESGVPPTASKPYQVVLQNRFSRDKQAIKQNLNAPTEQVIDVRHAVRYCGGQELKANLRRGHIPESINFPYTTMFDSQGMWRPIEKIRLQLSGVGVDLHTPIITSCGSAITAPVLNFALDIIGQTENAVYEGSWNEWGSDTLYSEESSLDERPVATCLD